MISSSYFGPARFNRIGKGVVYLGLAALLAMTAATAQIASGTTGIDATGNAQSELAACNSGKTQQDKTTCLTEVKNANAAKRAGKVDNSGGQFAANALKRCDVLKGEDRITCQARIQGLGNNDGSVASGGVVRQIESIVVPADTGSTLTVQPKNPANSIVVIPAPQ
jgi:hypothetical protein